MSYVISLLAALLLLGILILVHELGHYTAGRILKFKINEFSVGFGPRLFGWTRKDIKYSLRALPLGGYCMFSGEQEGDESAEKSFYNEKPWKRLIVMVSGCLMNFITAFLMAVVLLTCIGVPESNHSIGSVVEGSAAAQAGLQAGDEILAVDGTETPEAQDVITQIGKAEGKTSVITVLRDGEKKDIPVTPVYNEEEKRYMIGIYFGTDRVHLGLFESIGISAEYCRDVSGALFDFLKGLITKGTGAGDVTGPIGTVAVISETAREGFADSFAAGMSNLLQLGVLISMNLGILNILPLPALDGGKIIFVLYEMIFRRRVKPEHEAIVHLVGMALFIILAVVIGYQDIVRLIRGTL